VVETPRREKWDGQPPKIFLFIYLFIIFYLDLWGGRTTPKAHEVAEATPDRICDLKIFETKSYPLTEYSRLK
jgi:hypothetical protein